jgi:hypothetical protein
VLDYSIPRLFYIEFRIRKVLRIVQNKYMSTYREMKDDFSSDDTVFITHNAELRLEVKCYVFSSLSYSKFEYHKM